MFEITTAWLRDRGASNADCEHSLACKENTCRDLACVVLTGLGTIVYDNGPRGSADVQPLCASDRKDESLQNLELRIPPSLQ